MRKIIKLNKRLTKNAQREKKLLNYSTTKCKLLKKEDQA